MLQSLRKASILAVSGLVGLLFIVAAIICLVLDVPVVYALIASVVVLVLQFLLSPWLTDLQMKWIYKAKFDFELPCSLDAFVRGICEEQNMKFPKIGYIDDGAPNAFTYGRTKNDARIILTRGIFELLDEDEAKGVIAHELGHAAHYDMLIMTVVQLVPMVLYTIGDACLRSDTVKKASKSKDKDNGNAEMIRLGIGLICMLLYVIAQYVVLWLSRTREYYADTFAVSATGNPNALASALVTVGYGLNTRAGKNKPTAKSALGIAAAESSASMALECFDDTGAFNRESVQKAMRWDMWNVWAKIYEWKSTHPLISKRLLAISKMSPNYGQEPYVTFDEKQPESYLDDFAKEVVISALPWVIFILGLICCAFVANPVMAFGLTGVLTMIAALCKLAYTHPVGKYPASVVSDLLGEVKVSGITSIPCELRGEIIGRGNPGCVFNEDMVLKDGSGIIMLDYSQPGWLIRKFVAMFRNPEYFGKQALVRGWYRRSPVPYVEVLNFEIDGKAHKCHTLTFSRVIRWIGLILFAAIFVLGLMI